MTPYAILLVKPSDSDEVIRKTYYVLARDSHPDVVGTGSVARAKWELATEAYNAIKTEELRTVWTHHAALLAGLCAKCAGAGTVGTRMFKGKIRVCEACCGEGRVKTARKPAKL